MEIFRPIYKLIVNYLDSKQKNQGITNFNFNDIHLNDTKVLKDFALNYSWNKISKQYQKFIQSILKK